MESIRLGGQVTIKVSGESGEVVAIATYKARDLREVLVRYKAADGRACESWWTEDALEV